MSLRLFADHCVSNFITESLRDDGHAVLRLRDCIPHDSADSVVIAKAQQLDSILLSLNGDFADIVTYPPVNYRGIISLGIRNHPEVTSQIVQRLRDYFARRPDPDHYRGKLLIVEPHRIRIRE